MITGFNTDIEHDGVVYHVQTEDKGLDSPLILSLVYAGGAILASKRSRYEDLIAEGFNEEVLAQRLKKQHRLICAAINAGRLEDLKRMGAKPQDAVGATTIPPTTPTEAPEVSAEVAEIPPPEVFQPFEIVGVIGQTTGPLEPVVPVEIEVMPTQTTEPVETAPPFEFEIERMLTQTTEFVEKPPAPEPEPEVEPEPEPEVEAVPPRKRGRPRKDEAAYSLYDPRRQERPSKVEEDESGFALSLLDDDEEFLAGESYMIRVLVEDRSGKKRKPLSGVGVSLKILGTAFRPQIYSVKTERDGVATVDASMPSFTSGRAAVLIRVVVKGEPREVRRVIHPAEI